MTVRTPLTVTTLCVVPLASALLVCGAALADTDEPTSIPAEPTLTLDKNDMTGDVVLIWTATTSPYSIVRDTDPNPSDMTPSIISFGLVGTTFNDPILNDGSDYYYLVEDNNASTKVFGISNNAGLPGASITLTGIGFASVLADNQVFIAGEQAVVTSVTDTTLTFTIPALMVTGEVVVVTLQGANLGGVLYDIATDGLSNISSLAIDGLGTKFVADTGTAGTSDRVFTFDPSTGSRLEVGALSESYGTTVGHIEPRVLRQCRGERGQFR